MAGLLASISTFFAGVFGGLVESFTTLFTKRVAARISVVVALTAIWTTFSIAIDLAASTANSMMTEGVLAFSLSLLSSNTGLCISLILASYTAEFVFNQARMIMQIKNPY